MGQPEITDEMRLEAMGARPQFTGAQHPEPPEPEHNWNTCPVAQVGEWQLYCVADWGGVFHVYELAAAKAPAPKHGPRARWSSSVRT